MVRVESFEIGWNAQTAGAAAGVIVGTYFADIFGEAVKTATNQTGVSGFALEAAVKTGIGALWAYATKGATGISKIFSVFGIIGIAVSVVRDAIKLVWPGEAQSLGQRLGFALRARAAAAPAPMLPPAPMPPVSAPTAAFSS